MKWTQKYWWLCPWSIEHKFAFRKIIFISWCVFQCYKTLLFFFSLSLGQRTGLSLHLHPQGERHTNRHLGPFCSQIHGLITHLWIPSCRFATLWPRSWSQWRWARGQRSRHQPASVTSSPWPNASAQGNCWNGHGWRQTDGGSRSRFPFGSDRVDDVVRSMYPPLDPILLDAR